jgi:hypothetical protein
MQGVVSGRPATSLSVGRRLSNRRAKMLGTSCATQHGNTAPISSAEHTSSPGASRSASPPSRCPNAADHGQCLRCNCVPGAPPASVPRKQPSASRRLGFLVTTIPMEQNLGRFAAPRQLVASSSYPDGWCASSSSSSCSDVSASVRGDTPYAASHHEDFSGLTFHYLSIHIPPCRNTARQHYERRGIRFSACTLREPLNAKAA